MVYCIIRFVVTQDPNSDILYYPALVSSFLIFVSGIVTFPLLIWKFLDDPILGRYSFDTQGVTFYTPLRETSFRYDECAEIGFTQWVGGSTLHNQKYIYYIYFSKKMLTDEQRHFLFLGRSKTKRGKRNMPLYQSEYALFQYQPDVFSEFIQYVPEQFREKLILAEKRLDLKPYEKFLHR